MPIRLAIAADISAILALEKSSATAAHYSERHYIEIVDQDVRFGAASGLAASGEENSQCRLALVMEENSQVRGFLIGRALGNEWEIENIVVAEEARQRGLGAALVGEFLRTARERGGQTALLEVRESNAAARRLYERFQFRETGRRREYYRDPVEDALLYTRRLG